MVAYVIVGVIFTLGTVGAVVEMVKNPVRPEDFPDTTSLWQDWKNGPPVWLGPLGGFLFVLAVIMAIFWALDLPMLGDGDCGVGFGGAVYCEGQP